MTKRTDWIKRTCACGETFYILLDWERPPTHCKACRDKLDLVTIHCQGCKKSLTVPRAILKNKKPKFCSQCIETKNCEDCGKPFKTPKSWERKFCNGCIEIRQCVDCGKPLKFPKSWENKPEFCKQCGENLIKDTCLGWQCSTPITFKKKHRNNPVLWFCKSCRSNGVSCKICGGGGDEVLPDGRIRTCCICCGSGTVWLKRVIHTEKYCGDDNYNHGFNYLECLLTLRELGEN